MQIWNFSLFYFCISQYIFKAWWSAAKRMGSDNEIDALEWMFGGIKLSKIYKTIR